MKHFFLISVFLLFSSLPAFSDISNLFSSAMQKATRYSACLGKYNPAEAKIDYEPANYYTEILIAKQLAEESGNRTRTLTFYGVCFDYACCTIANIDRFQNYYSEKGMMKKSFYIADTLNGNQIILSLPTKNHPDRITNGVPLQNIKTMNVKSHKDSQGFRATNHAWVWVQREDGVWFWLDPTWTDNLGYIVWGYVKDGEEIQLKPDREYCICYPSFLNSLPEVPKMQPQNNSKNTTENIDDYRLEPNYFLFGGGVSFSDSKLIDKGAAKISLLGALDWVCFVQIPLQFEWNKENSSDSKGGCLIGVELGKTIIKFQNDAGIGLYGLGSLGLFFNNYTKQTDDGLHSDYNCCFDYKLGGGIYAHYHNLVLTTDYSYTPVIGSNVTVGIALGLGDPVKRKK